MGHRGRGRRRRRRDHPYRSPTERSAERGGSGATTTAPASPAPATAAPSAPITGRWVTDSTPALQIAVPRDDHHAYYWRVVAYDHFDGSGWSWTRQSAADRPSGTDVLAGTTEAAELAPVLRRVTFGVTPLAYRSSTVISPGAPLSVDQNTTVTLVGGAYFGALDLASSSGSYAVTSVVPQTADDDPAGLTENQLRAATTVYPADITKLYLDVPTGTTGPDMRSLRPPSKVWPGRKPVRPRADGRRLPAVADGVHLQHGRHGPQLR